MRSGAIVHGARGVGCCLLWAASAIAQIPNHPVITEVFCDPPGVNDGPFGRTPGNPHQEFLEIYLPPAASLSASLMPFKDSLNLTLYEVEGDLNSSGYTLVNYRIDLPTFDLDGGSAPPVVNRPSSGIVVLGWVDYASTTPAVVLAGTPSTRVAMVNGGIVATDGTYTFVAMNGAHGTDTTNFPKPTALSLINMPGEAGSGIVQNGSGAYLLVHRLVGSGYVERFDDEDAPTVPASCSCTPSSCTPDCTNADLKLASGLGLATTALLDGFAVNDDSAFDVFKQPYAINDGVNLARVLPLGGPFSNLLAQVPENDSSVTLPGMANGYARRFVDIAKTTETAAVDDPVVDATTAYRHVRNDGPFFPNPGRAVLTTSAPELGLARAIEHSVEVLAQTTGRPGLLAANVGGNYPINMATSAGASTPAGIATFGAGVSATGVPGQSLAFPSVAVTPAVGATHGSVASATITVTATNAVGGQPAVVAPVQMTTMTATVLKPTTGLNAAGMPFQTTVFAAVQGIPANAGVSNEFRATSVGTFIANNLGGAAQGTFCTTIGLDCVPHAPILIDPATNLGNGAQMDALVKTFPDPDAFVNYAGPPGKLDLLQTVLQSAEVASGASTYDASVDGVGVRARHANIPDTLAFDGSFTPSEPLYFADATGRTGQVRSGLSNATTTRTFELAILDTNTRLDNTIETGANDDFGVIIEVAATEVGSPVVPGEFVFLSFTGGLQGADIDGVEVPPGNNIATVIFLDTDNLHSILGIRVIEAIYLLDAGDTGDLNPVDVFSLNPSAQPPALVSAAPVNGSSLWRSTQNIIRLTFNQNITAPGAGQLQIRQLLPNGQFGADLSSGFTFTVENDGGGNPRILKILDPDPASLVHRQWYGIRNAGTWPGVADFEVQYVVQVGDADGDKQVLNLDAGVINAAIPTFNPADSDRRNIDADTAILNADVSAANARIPSFNVAKPSGH